MQTLNYSTTPGEKVVFEAKTTKPLSLKMIFPDGTIVESVVYPGSATTITLGTGEAPKFILDDC